MTYLFNIMPFLIVLVFGIIIRYAVPSKAGKVVFAVIGVMAMIIYFQIQPSYLPKGTVRSDPVVEFTPNNSVIIDRQLKSVTREQRLLELQDDYDAANKRREEMVEKLKGEKPEL